MATGHGPDGTDLELASGTGRLQAGYRENFGFSDRDIVLGLAWKLQLASKGLSARRYLEMISGIWELCSHSQ